MIDRICIVCGKKFKARTRDIVRGYAKCCSRECLRKNSPNSIDLTGKQIGRWVVLEKTNIIKNKEQYYKCRCNCGTVRNVSGRAMRRGNSLSCGCLEKENNKRKFTIHGSCGTRLYGIMHGMRARCFNKNEPGYKNYGGRGITICEEWNDFKNFRDWALANGYKDNLSIDRINNDGNYEPSNCRWATQKEQLSNTRRNNIVTINGETHIVTDWVTKTGIPFKCLTERIKMGLKNDELLKPVNYYYQTYIYNLIDPEGNKYENIINLLNFCKEKNLDYERVRHCFLENKNTYKNWKINRIKK